MRLTATKAKNAKKRDKDYKLFDGNGLYLLVRKNGAKYWRLKFRYAGKEKLLAIGVYPETSLSQARQETAKYRSTLKQGSDPSLERKTEKIRKRYRSENSFYHVAEEWIEVQDSNWASIHSNKVKRSLELNVYPHIGHMPISEIDPPLIIEVIRKIEARDALDLSSRVFQRVNSIFRFAVQSGRTRSNPASELKGALRSRKAVHRRGLPADQLRMLLKELDSYHGEAGTIFALKLLMLTFTRPSEVRAARWTEFDLTQREWRIPAQRMKMGTDHIVPLSTQVISLLQVLRQLTGNHELLFPSSRNPQKPISDNALIYALHRLGYKNRVSPHGFRSSASTILNEIGYLPDVIERQLSHLERNKVRAAYNHAQYLEKRREMMQFWSDHLNGQR